MEKKTIPIIKTWETTKKGKEDKIKKNLENGLVIRLTIISIAVKLIMEVKPNKKVLANIETQLNW